MRTTAENETTRPANRAAPAEFIAPEVNIYEINDSYVIEAEMPDVSKDGLEITLEGTELAITGRRTGEKAAGEPLFRERPTADFRRVFELDPAIDTSNIAAMMHQGVLTLTLPKSERVKPRKIVVND